MEALNGSESPRRPIDEVMAEYTASSTGIASVEAKAPTNALSERLVDATKIDFSNFESGVENSVTALIEAGFRVKFNVDTLEGVASYKGLKVDFTTGGENLYFELPKFYFKSAPEDAAKAVKNLLGEVSNWGDTVDS
jgi:hypothetical protein